MTPLLTIFTPTYNRAHLLPELYESLCRQTCHNFEWLVVDDGSTDGTEAVMRRMETERRIPIRYIRKDNGGKHTAINLGVQEAHGQLFFIVDSDDSITPDAAEWILRQWEDVKDDPSFCGLSGTRVNPDGTSISSPSYRFGTIDATSCEIRYKYAIPGDLAEIWRTDTLRRYPFPEFEGERFCSEGLVWMRMAADGLRVRYVDQGIYVCQYREGGLTDTSVQTRMKSPRASTLLYSEFVRMPWPWHWRLRQAVNYWRFRCCLPRGAKAPAVPRHWAFVRPLGWLMHLRDKHLK